VPGLKGNDMDKLKRTGWKWFIIPTLAGILAAVHLGCATAGGRSAGQERLEPLIRMVDLDVGESAKVTLADGSVAEVKLLDLRERRGHMRDAVRHAEVTVEINGEQRDLVASFYHLPKMVGGVQADCAVTKGFVEPHKNPWAIEKDARIRLWPKDSPWIRPGTFVYPVRERWFATDTQMANVPVFVDGGEIPGQDRIYYHNGLDFGGSEKMVEVVSACEGTVISAGEKILENFPEPVRPRYDVVYIQGPRGWCYRYSHLDSIDPAMVPGAKVKMGQKLGIMGKEGGSGGWSHLHFGVNGIVPSGKWGTVNGYCFIWQAYQQQYGPKVIAVARPHKLAWAGEEITLDGRKSWSKSGRIAKYQWSLSDGRTVAGPWVKIIYDKPGTYSEVLKVTDERGNVDYDYVVCQICNKDNPQKLPPTISANFHPTLDIAPGEQVTFKVRTFRTDHGREIWDFGDGSEKVTVKSQSQDQHNPKGYAVTTHSYQQPGHYIATVSRTNENGYTATAHLHIPVGVSGR